MLHCRNCKDFSMVRLHDVQVLGQGAMTSKGQARTREEENQDKNCVFKKVFLAEILMLKNE